MFLLGYSAGIIETQSWSVPVLMQAQFNCRKTNLRGERFRVLIGETQEAGEGCSFFNVRELFLGKKQWSETSVCKCKSTHHSGWVCGMCSHVFLFLRSIYFFAL